MRNIRITFTITALSALLLSGGAAFAAEAAPAPAKAAAGKKLTYGKAFTAAAPVTVAAVLAAPEKFEGKSIKMTGLVTKVCQKKGCWFEVAPTDKDRGIRIKSADYSIFVPFDSAGRTCTVEGTFQSKTLTEQQAKHMAEDGAKAGEKPADVKGAAKEFQVAAVAVELN